MSGDDVKELQNFLKLLPDIYPEGLVTGYYGKLTQTAVMRFQDQHAVVKMGTPETTGYGQVGPRTLLKINEAITSGTASAFGTGTSVPVTFQYTGTPQTYTVPAGVSSLHVDARAAQGGSSDGAGGLGGRVQTTIAVTPGETLYMYVGGVGGSPAGSTAGAGGVNGGGPGGTGCGHGSCVKGGAGGGGASDVRRGGTAISNRVVVAAGGGGGTKYAGGAGGGLTGADGGAPPSNPDLGGDGGTQTNGGLNCGGSPTGCGASGQTEGSLGQGGTGGSDLYAGGGGGSGYYGGAGGQARQDPDTGAGGGGSSFSAGTETVHEQGVQSGNGAITLTPLS